jgi:hypothetical protein
MPNNNDKHTASDKAWEQGFDTYIDYVCNTILESVGGKLDSETMGVLSTDQHTILAYRWLKEEVMEGGFIQLIYNGYAPYILQSPFPYVIKKEWGLKDFSKLLFNVKREYHQHMNEFEGELSEEDFMALYEKLEKLNDYGDDFLDDFQEEVTAYIAQYVRNNEFKFLNN